MWVREDYRGYGYGRRMLALMCRQSRIEGRLKTWGLITTETEGFYSKVKFILTSDEVQDEDGPYYFMIRDSYEPMAYMGDWEGVEDVIEKRPEDFTGAVEYCIDGEAIDYDDIDPIEFLNGADV